MRFERTKNAKRNIKWGLFNQLITIVGPFILRTIILQTLGTEYLGVSSLFTSILHVLNLAELGFSSAIVYNMYEPVATDDTETVCALLRLYKKIYYIIGAVILTAGLLLLPFLKQLIKGGYPEDISLYMVYLIYLTDVCSGYFILAYKSCLLTVHQRDDIISKVSLITKSLVYALQAALLLKFNSYMIYIVILPLYNIINNIVCAYIASKKYPQYVCAGNVDANIRKNIKTQVGGLMITKIAGTTRNSFDNIILSAFIGINIVGIYGNYYYILTGVESVLLVLLRSLSSGVGNSVAVEPVEKNYCDFKKITFTYAWLASWCAVCMMSLYQPFMIIWAGPDKLFPTSIVALICTYFWALTTGDVPSIYIDATGIWWKYKLKAVVEAISNLVLNLLLVNVMGITGIVLATIITRVLFGFIWGEIILFRQYFGRERMAEYFMRYIAYSVTTVVTAYISFSLCEMVEKTGFSGLILRMMICSLVSVFGFACVFCRTDEFKQMRRMAAKVLLRRKGL